MKKTELMEMLGVFTCILILNLTLVSAQTLKVTKSVPEEIKFGDILEVNIIIENLEIREVEIQIKELIGDAEPIDPSELNRPSSPTGCKYCMPPPYYSWDIILQPEETRSIVYKIKPMHPGDFILSKTTVTTSEGETYYSNLVSTYVICNENNICEKTLAENYINCPEDCPSGSEDNLCDLMEDGVCDPDCTEGSDPDCPICGNNICENDENENNCPEDCLEVKDVERGFPWLFLVIGGLILIVIIVIFFTRKKSNKKDNFK